MIQTVYVDIVFLENFIMNYLLLYSVGRYCNYKFKWWRVGLGSILGTLYVFAMFFNNTNFLYNAAIKFLMSVLMLNIAFSIKSLKQLVKATILFYISAFMISGSILAISYFFDSNLETINGSIIIKDVTVWNVIIGSFLVFILLKLVFDFLENYFKMQRKEIELSIVIESKSIKVRALIDTGNCLRDPSTGEQVVVIYVNAILNILPMELKTLIELAQRENSTIVQKVSQTDIGNIRQIPFKTLGEDNGVLIGISTDYIQLKVKGKNIVLKNGIIALYDKPLSDFEGYEAIAYPEILNRR